MTDLLRADEFAPLVGLSVWTVRSMARKGLIRRMPGTRLLRIPRSEVERLLTGVYDGGYAQSTGEAATEASSSRRGKRRPAHGSLAGEAVGGDRALLRAIGSEEGDVVVRRVAPRGGGAAPT